MAFEILPADLAIRKMISIRISDTPEPIGGSLPGLGSDIPMQFPPKFASDGKSGNWRQIDVSSYEPLVIFSGANARAISIELTYINDGGEFDGARIAGIEKMIKSYFYRRIEDSTSNTPVIEIRRLYGAVNPAGNEKTTWRLKDVDIQHGDGIILSSNGAFPLSSRITMNLETYTQMGGRGGGSNISAAGSAAATPETSIPSQNERAASLAASGLKDAGQSSKGVIQFQKNLEKIVKSFWY